jgi:hypothetical protein
MRSPLNIDVAGRDQLGSMRLLLPIALALVVGCAAHSTHSNARVTTPSVTSIDVPSQPEHGTAAVDPEHILSAMRDDAVECYRNRKATSDDGRARVMLNVATQDGHVTCVVPNEEAGLSKDVEECLVSRLEREPFPRGVNSRLAVPLVFEEDDVALGKDPPRTGPATAFESAETHGFHRATLSQKLAEELHDCVRDGRLETSSIAGAFYVHAKVGPSGKVLCTVANRGETVPEQVRSCAMDKLSKWRFPPPKYGVGSVSIPVRIPMP